MSDLLTDLEWSTVRQQAIDEFNGELPRADTEAAIIDVFELAPRAVTRAITETAGSLQRGEIRSGWAILRTRLEQRAQPVRDVHVKGVDERARRISQAEQWLRTCGIHFDRDSEVEDELFGDRGLLRAWADDIALKGRMLTAWRTEHRPTGEQLEHDADERAEQWITSHTCDRCGKVYPFASGCTCTKRLDQTRELLKRNGIPTEVPTVTHDDEPEPQLAGAVTE